MHYDPYESLASKKRRWLSNICMIILGLLMVGGILALIFREGENPKFKFDHLKHKPFTVAQLSSEKSEFKMLKDSLSVKNKSLFDDSFRADFPVASALLDMDNSIYSAEKPYVAVGGGYIAIAQCGVSYQTDCRDLAVTLIGLQSTVNDNELTLYISDVQEYTVRYNTRDRSVPLTYLSDGNGTRVDIYKIGITAKNSSLENSSYRLKLNRAFEEERARARLHHQIIFDPLGSSYHNPDIETEEKSTNVSIKPFEAVTDKDGNKIVKYDINLNGNVFYLFESVDFKYSTDNPEQTEITVEFN